MKSRHEIHAELEYMVARGEAALERLKGRAGAAGHEVSAEAKEATAAAERALARGKATGADFSQADGSMPFKASKSAGI